jgi:hypothetical protein
MNIWLGQSVLQNAISGKAGWYACAANGSKAEHLSRRRGGR